MSALTQQDQTVAPASSTDVEITTPLERFYRWEKETPNQLFMTQPYGLGRVESFTWGRVAQEVRKMAAYLKSLNLEPGSNIAILSKNCAHWIMSDLAIWLAGHVSVPLYPTLSADSIRQIMEHSGAKVLFVGKLDDWDAQAPGVPEDVECISYPLSPHTNFVSWDEVVARQPAMTENPVPNPEQIATIIYTSGTTGMPKGVVHTFATLSYAASQAVSIYHLDSNDRVLSYLPLSHVAERMVVELASVYQSISIYFAESLDTFAEDLQRAQPTVFFAVPRIWIKFQMGVLAKMPQERLNLLFKIPFVSGLIKKKIRNALALNNARFNLSGAAPISNSLLNWYKEIGIEILEVYGMTENMGYSHSTRVGESKVGYVGRTNPGMVTRIDDSGEILVKGPSVMQGYYKEPEKTAEVLTEDGYLRTGDVGEVDSRGQLKITGRIKEIFKTSKGKYVAPAPIENKLLEDPNIEMLCVVGSGLPQPIGIAMLSEAARDSLAESGTKESLSESFGSLLDQVNGAIEKHENLATLVVVSDEWATENGFLTPTLKIKRNIIDERYGENYESWYADKAKIIFKD